MSDKCPKCGLALATYAYGHKVSGELPNTIHQIGGPECQRLAAKDAEIAGLRGHLQSIRKEYDWYKQVWGESPSNPEDISNAKLNLIIALDYVFSCEAAKETK